ncbi:hypothetical protein F4814DRAFT_456453 [Daldinia grandis]|nr:hypothetical protein F4814DRAFT_456453 [Daldinia grandis]
MDSRADELLDYLYENAAANPPTFYNWRPTLPFRPSPNDHVNRAFDSVESQIRPNRSAALCREQPSSPMPTPPPPVDKSKLYRRVGLTHSDLEWLVTHERIPSDCPPCELPTAERQHPDCSVCMSEPSLRCAGYICGFHTCVMVGACSLVEIRAVSRLFQIDPYAGGIRSREEPLLLLSTLFGIRTLLANSTPERNRTVSQLAANAGQFGAVGDGRPGR